MSALTENVPAYVRAVVPYDPGKPLEQLRREHGLRRIAELASNENPLGPSPRALEAVRKRLRSVHRYPDGSAFELKRALARKLRRRPEELIIGNGSNELIDMLVRTFCVPGDAIVTSKAAFLAYRLSASIHGARTLEAPLGDCLKADLGEMARLVREDRRARLVFIANPNNPTGTYNTAAELRRFLREVAAVRGASVLVALDYAYWEYVTAEDLPEPARLLRDFPGVVVLRTFSKVYGLAGLRVGYAIARPGIIGYVEKVRQPFNVSSLALAAAEAALSDRGFVGRSVRANMEGMRFWEEGLRRLSIPYWKSQGNFLLADVGRGLGRSGAEIHRACLGRGAIFRPVAGYGLPNALRISVGTKAENEIGLRALAAQRELETIRGALEGTVA